MEWLNTLINEEAPGCFNNFQFLPIESIGESSEFFSAKLEELLTTEDEKNYSNLTYAVIIHYKNNPCLLLFVFDTDTTNVVINSFEKYKNGGEQAAPKGLSEALPKLLGGLEHEDAFTVTKDEIDAYVIWNNIRINEFFKYVTIEKNEMELVTDIMICKDIYLHNSSPFHLGIPSAENEEMVIKIVKASDILTEIIFITNALMFYHHDELFIIFLADHEDYKEVCTIIGPKNTSDLVYQLLCFVVDNIKKKSDIEPNLIKFEKAKSFLKEKEPGLFRN